MNRRKVEGIIWFVAGFILILLLANKSKMLSDNVGENIFSLILSGITLFFGKMTWFIAIVSMLYGIILFFYEKIGINITQGKVVALTGLFLSWGMILIRGSLQIFSILFCRQFSFFLFIIITFIIFYYFLQNFIPKFDKIPN